MRCILLESEDLESLHWATLAEDIKQIRLSRLHRSACHLQVVITRGDRLCLLPLVEEHVDCGLTQENVRFK